MKVDRGRINEETQEKSKTFAKGKSKKPQRKNNELQKRQSLQPQTGPREVRQSDSQPARTHEPLPGTFRELDESVSNCGRQDGQVREETVKNRMFSVENIDKLLSSQRSNGIR